MAIRTIADVHQFLDSIPAFKAAGKEAADFSLDRFRRFCAAIDNPQEQFRSIHVAGSNGKGSTCNIIASIYRQAGYKTGIYTSPHIVSYNERFVINGVDISDDELLSFFQTHEALIKSFRLTYFEISTAIAFWWFAGQQVNVAIIETGLGGRLDATNIITPVASVITTVTLDHTDILGDTIEAIAAEKAGIIKQEVPLIVGNTPERALDVILERADEQSAAVYQAEQLEPRWEKGTYYLKKGDEQITLESTLKTAVQAHNIAVAWRLITVLQNELPVTDGQRREGVKRAGLRANMARFEQLHPELDWYFDGAHNVQAIREMKKMVQTIRPVDRSILVLALMSDKLTKKMASEFSEFKKIIYHTLPLGRAASFKNVKQWLPRVEPFPNQPKARNSLLKEFESELVIFSGSFYFYPAVRDWLTTFKDSQ